MIRRRFSYIAILGVAAIVIVIGLRRAERADQTPDPDSTDRSATGEIPERGSARETDTTRSPTPGVAPKDSVAANPQEPNGALPAADSVVNGELIHSASGAEGAPTARVTSTVVPPGETKGRPPLGWHLGEDVPSSYVLVTDTTVVWNGSRSAAVYSPKGDRAEVGDTFVWQAANAEPFRGQRVRFSAYVRIENAGNPAHLTMRAEDLSGRIVAFDNMSGRWIQGSADWRQLALVVDIPDSASVLIYGAGFVKPGSLWLDDIEITPVDKSVNVTLPPMTLNHSNNPLEKSLVAPSPFNLGFEIETPE
jgi:hypothetical protein